MADPSAGPPAGGGGDLVYPKGLTLTQRHALQNRLAVLNHDRAQEVLDELSGRMAIAQVNNPIRYCAALVQSMQRGEFAPELGLKVLDARRAEIALRAELVRIQERAVTTPGEESRDLPIEFQEAIARLRARSSAGLNKDK